MIWNLFQFLSNELSDPLQQSFLIYDEEKMISKIYGQFYLKQKIGYFATSTNSTWPHGRRVFYPWKAVYTSSTVNRGKTGIDLFLRKYSLYLANSF
jgi:hypothetical protein